MGHKLASVPATRVPSERFLEISRLVTGKRLRYIGQQGFGMNQAFVYRERIEKRFQSRAGRANEIAVMSPPWAQGVGGSNPLAPIYPWPFGFPRMAKRALDPPVRLRTL